MKPIKIFPENSFIQGINFESEIQYNLFVDTIPQNINKDEINILFLCEPDVISGLIKNLPFFAGAFDYILTHNQEVLDKYPNAVLYNFNSIWIDTNNKYEPKEFNISTVVGGKTWTKHQVMRHELWYCQEEISNKKFYLGAFGAPSDTFGNPILKDGKKEPMFMSQFHIAIENCSIRNYFSEKILDCFISKTVPIYCGCLNIGDYFNDKGILKFSNIKECVSVCENINENTYSELLPYVEENYNKALEYIDWQKKLSDLLTKIHTEKALL